MAKSLTYNLTSGSLPAGYTLNEKTGVLSGVSTAPYTVGGVASTFTVTATDGASSTPRAFTITRKWLDGSTSALAATSAAQIRADTGLTTNGIYYINLPTVGITQTYCLMDPGLGGGGWMMAMKCTRGNTFGYSTNYWTTANTLNPVTGLNRSDADAKFDTFNYYPATDVISIFPDATSTYTLASVVITSTTGDFYCTNIWMQVGQPVVITGTYGGGGSITGYTTGNTYYIIDVNYDRANSRTTFRLSSSNPTLGAATPITTTAGTPTGITFTLPSISPLGPTYNGSAGGWTMYFPLSTSQRVREAYNVSGSGRRTLLDLFSSYMTTVHTGDNTRSQQFSAGATQFQVFDNPTGGDRSSSGKIGPWSSQGGYKWYGINHSEGTSAMRVRWGFAWNNEGGPDSGDVFSGWGPSNPGYSCGDQITAANDIGGLNRSMRGEMYVR